MSEFRRQLADQAHRSIRSWLSETDCKQVTVPVPEAIAEALAKHGEVRSEQDLAHLLLTSLMSDPSIRYVCRLEPTAEEARAMFGGALAGAFRRAADARRNAP